MKLLILCPIPIEFNACRRMLSLRDTGLFLGKRAGRATLADCEIFVLESGPAKTRAAGTAAAGCLHFSPDLVLDSGSCAGIAPGTMIGEILISQYCYEYDISGQGFPQGAMAEMKLPSAFYLLDAVSRELLLRDVVDSGRTAGLAVRVGDQACGEYLIQSLSMRETLYSLFQATAANWETAAVFVAALKAGVPPLSVRVVTDLGKRNARREFQSNVRRRSEELYQFIHLLVENGWFGSFLERWQRIDPAKRRSLPSLVLP